MIRFDFHAAEQPDQDHRHLQPAARAPRRGGDAGDHHEKSWHPRLHPRLALGPEQRRHSQRRQPREDRRGQQGADQGMDRRLIYFIGSDEYLV